MNDKVTDVHDEDESTLEESFLSKSKRTALNGWNKFKFVVSALLLLLTFAFSLFGLSFKLIKNGFTTSTIILSIATSMYLVILLLYWILLKARLNGKDDWKHKESIYNVKYLIRIVKVIVPITLLFNLIGKPLYDYIVIFFSGISIFFGLLSFTIATVKTIKRVKSRKRRKEKHDAKNKRAS